MELSTADPVFSRPHNSVDRRKGYCGGCTALGGRDGVALKKCVKCKIAQYCSKECQKKDWSRHKAVCGELAGGVMKIANYLTRNDHTRLWLEVALALLFELDKDWTPEDWREFVERPSFACIEFYMEPSDIHTMLRLISDPSNFDYRNVEAMLQVLNVLKQEQYDPPQKPTAGQLEYWTAGRAELIRRGMDDVPVVSVIVGNRLVEALVLSIAVYPKTVNIARRKEPFYSFSPLAGKMSKFEFSPKNILMHMNMHIRADIHNSMRLRQPLREVDAWQLADAVQNVPGHVEDTIRRKLAYEELYQPNARYDLKIPFPLILIRKDSDSHYYHSIIPDPLTVTRRSPQHVEDHRQSEEK